MKSRNDPKLWSMKCIERESVRYVLADAFNTDTT
jgi:hypothetical protein